MNERKNKKQSAKAQPQQHQEQQKQAVKSVEKEAEHVCSIIPSPGAQLSPEEMRNAIFWSEIIAKPKYLESREKRRAKFNAGAPAEGAGE